MKDKWSEGWGGCARPAQHVFAGALLSSAVAVSARVRYPAFLKAAVPDRAFHIHPPPGCPLNADLPKNRLLFYLSALLMLTGLTTLQVFLAFYWKIWCNNLHSQLGKLRHGEMNKVMKGQKHRNSPWWSPIHCQCLETVPLRVF